MKIKWLRLLLLLVLGVLMTSGLAIVFDISFWWRIAVMQVPMMALVWLIKPIVWEK